MKLDRIIKTAIKWGPVIYPIVKKLIDSRSSAKPTTTQTPRKRP